VKAVADPVEARDGVVLADFGGSRTFGGRSIEWCEDQGELLSVEARG